jgi:hypothetical protein
MAEPCGICKKRIAVEQDLFGEAWCAVCLKEKQDTEWEDRQRDEDYELAEQSDAWQRRGGGGL